MGLYSVKNAIERKGIVEYRGKEEDAEEARVRGEGEAPFGSGLPERQTRAFGVGSALKVFNKDIARGIAKKRRCRTKVKEIEDASESFWWCAKQSFLWCRLNANFFS